MNTMEYTQPLANISLLVVDYNALLHKNGTEIDKICKACTELGFFYLKVDNGLLDPDPLFELAEKVFQLPLDDNLLYEMDGKSGVYYGYKSVGSMVSDKNGSPDKIEFWNISKDEILVRDGTTFPKVILDAKDTIKNFMTKSHGIVRVILEVLSLNLGLDSQVLSNLHRLVESSGDQLRLTKTTMHPYQNHHVPDVSLGAHTDYGSIRFSSIACSACKFCRPIRNGCMFRRCQDMLLLILEMLW